MNESPVARRSLVEIAEDAFHLARGIESVGERTLALRVRVRGGPETMQPFQVDPGSESQALIESLDASLSAIRERLTWLDDEIRAISAAVSPERLATDLAGKEGVARHPDIVTRTQGRFR